MGLTEVYKTMKNFQNGYLGDCFVKFLEPINVKNYLQ